ncbi:MAG: septum formation initiator family protein [Candidatus Saganbacteria bacterium]|nr:septum formation initiator family protein [Candidatus Saganbacteria bacterium]
MKRIGFILFVLIVIYFIFLIRQDIIGNIDLKAQERSLIKNIGQEEILEKDLRARLKNLNTQADIERIARTKLGLVKKGEIAYKVIND